MYPDTFFRIKLVSADQQKRFVVQPIILSSKCLSIRPEMSTLSNVAFPPYTIFHATLGYSIVLIGLSAMISRICVMCSKNELKRDKWRRIHRVCGRTWLMGTYLMPVTAIWVKPWDVEWDFVAFFIFSMYISLIAGFTCIKIREVLPNERIRTLLKCLHGIFMVYSWCMLVGAGISFPFRAANRVYANNSTVG